LPFLPVRGHAGSGYLKIRPDWLTVVDPYSDRKVLVVPAIKPDFCLLHAYFGDDEGNVLMDRTSDSELAAKGAGLTVVSVEERAGDLEAVRGPQMKRLSGFHVDYLVQAPGGAAPTACPGRYALDEAYLKDYLAAAQAGRLADWLQARVLNGEEQ